MGQLIACAAAEGVLVASDSRTVFFEPHGEERFINIDRVVPVTSHAVLVAWTSGTTNSTIQVARIDSARGRPTH